MIGPLVSELAEDYKDRAVITKMDVDSNPATAAKFGIRNIPTILFFKGGDIADKQVGAVPKTILAAKIDKVLLEHKLNDDIRKKYIQATNSFPLFSLIKIKKGQLEGLGDIELFQECDMSNQYLLNQKHINAVMTFDENLYEVLSRRQTMVASHTPIYGQDPKRIQQEKLNEFFSATNDMLVAHEREEAFFESAIIYLDELLR